MISWLQIKSEVLSLFQYSSSVVLWHLAALESIIACNGDDMTGHASMWQMLGHGSVDALDKLARGCSCFNCMRQCFSAHCSKFGAHSVDRNLTAGQERWHRGNHPRHFYRQLQPKRACTTLRSHDHECAHNLNQIALLSSGLAPCCQPIKGQIFQATKVQKQVDRKCRHRGYHSDHHDMTAPLPSTSRSLSDLRKFSAARCACAV